MKSNLHLSVEKYIGRATLIEIVFEHLKFEWDGTGSRSYALGNEIKGKIVRGELLTDRDKIDFSNYILEYHVDFQTLAQKYLDEFKTLFQQEG